MRPFNSHLKVDVGSSITSDTYGYLLALVSGTLIGLSFLFPNLFFLVWVAFVPLLVALHQSTLRQAYCLGLVSGLAILALSTYWIGEFIYNLKGYSWPLRTLLSLLFWFYSAQIVAFMALLYRFLIKKTPVSPLIVFPTVLCLSFAFFPSMFPVQIGATQSGFLIALQAVEFTGVYGLDFLIGIVNVFLFVVLGKYYWPGRDTIIALAAVIIWFAYGALALQHWDGITKRSSTAVIGLVQVNESPSVQKSMPAANFSYAYPKEMKMSKALVDASVALIVWPEARHRGYFSHPHVGEAFRYYAQNFSTPFIFQDNESVNSGADVLRFNTSVYINSSGEEEGKYRKIKRIPIGEYLPVFNENTTAKKLLRDYVGDFFADLTSGERASMFRLEFSKPSVAVPLMCYELIFPSFVAGAVPSFEGPVFLLGQSNNAWFGDTVQPHQHLRAAILRSVENRLPLVHATNNGPSALVSPSGRIMVKTPHGELGAYTMALPLVDGETKTFFGRFPYAFLMLVSLILLAIFAYALWRPLIRKAQL